MNKSVAQAEAALSSANSAYLSELESDIERQEGSGAQERRRDDRRQALGDAVAQCERDLEEAKRRAVFDDLANRLMKLRHTLENRGDRGNDWSLARALEDRIGAYQPATGDFDEAGRLLKNYGF